MYQNDADVITNDHTVGPSVCLFVTLLSHAGTVQHYRNYISHQRQSGFQFFFTPNSVVMNLGFTSRTSALKGGNPTVKNDNLTNTLR